MARLAAAWLVAADTPIVMICATPTAAARLVVPDIAGWRRERLPAIPDAAALSLPPDWACEIVSPSTGALDRGRKMQVYARERVGHLWIVDPGPRTVEVYRPEGGRWVVASTHAGSMAARAEPFDAVELDMSRWWRES